MADGHPESSDTTQSMKRYSFRLCAFAALLFAGLPLVASAQPGKPGPGKPGGFGKPGVGPVGKPLARPVAKPFVRPIGKPLVRPFVAPRRLVPPPPLPPRLVRPPLVRPIPVPVPLAVGAAARVSVVADSLNARWGPGTDYPVITSLPYGTVLSVLGESGGWYQVQLSDEYTGWVASNYVVAAP